MSSYNFDGNFDMYGLGIRLGYYLQWFGTIIAAWIADSEVESLRLGNSFFVAATFLALIVQVALQNLETVVLLLTFGSSFYLVPILLWRFLTGFRAEWDPTRTQRAKPVSTTFNYLSSALLIAVSSFQIWFWVARVPQLASADCPSYGFLFARVPLDSAALRWLNVVLCALLLGFLLALRVMRVFNLLDIVGRELGSKLDREDEKKVRYKTFAIVDSTFKFAVASIIVTATELTIFWNGISGVHSIKSAGQLIPLVLGLAAVIRVFYEANKNFKEDKAKTPKDIRFFRNLHRIRWDNVQVTESGSVASCHDQITPLEQPGPTPSPPSHRGGISPRSDL